MGALDWPLYYSHFSICSLLFPNVFSSVPIFKVGCHNTMGKACEECTMHCVMMHKKNKNPSSLVTTFVKVMIGDDYSKILLLPPSFSRRGKKLVDKRTHLEDLNGVKWDVKFTKIDNQLALEEGWNTFALTHGLQKGDILVFHYIMKSHFVVLMYGSTGCPENRHFGFSHNPMKETKKNNNNFVVNGQSPSEVHTNFTDFSHESSSKSEPPVPGVNDMKTMNKKLDRAKMSPNENTTNTQHLVASSSRPVVKETDQRPEPLVINTNKETDQRSEPLVKNTVPDYMVSKSPTTVKPFCLVDNDNGHEQDECRTNSLPPVVVESDGGQKNNVAAGGGGGSDETEINRFRKALETRLEMAAEKRKEGTVKQGEVAHSNSRHKRLRPDNVPITPAKVVKREPDTSASRLHNSGYPFTSTGISPKPMAKRMEPIKKEPTMNHGLGGLLKKEPTMNHGSGGLPKKVPTMNHGSGGMIKKEPKPEPVDYDEAPLSGPSNTSFSATMSSYQYLELPGWVKLKSKVILLRNGTDLWAVLYQTKFGLKALTQNWGTFAKEKGIKPGDKCEFVLESEPNSRFTCNVFDVHITR
ncbi:hypothetical protein L1987_47447 [Smallanthus sonchifolius]|uniref:Uncharacterized protein n=1 Tax=Smallanthus sonchifolius TaxID=185202 RepID=A0ACB9G3I7_9ASTR|nr:hypothetical protein L1987_47447 [Smallanthus sonchifolius]